MGKRFLWLVPMVALLSLAGCGKVNGVIPTPTLPGPTTIASIDDACQALSADDVNRALGVTDVILLADGPHVNIATLQTEPGHECVYVNDVSDNPYGLTFSIVRFSDAAWANARDEKVTWEKVAIGDEAYQATQPYAISVHNGDWMITVNGYPPPGKLPANFTLIMYNMVDLFVSRLPRQ